MLTKGLLLFSTLYAASSGFTPHSLTELKDPFSNLSNVLDVVPGAYIVQFNHDAGLPENLRRRTGIDLHSHFHKRATEEGLNYEVNYEFKNRDIFYGLSVKLEKDEDSTKLENITSVAKVFPVRKIPRPHPIGARNPATSKKSKKASRKRRNFKGSNVNTPHKMTGVDELHRRGIKGKGIRIGIIDSGVDYTLPALGGCFGPGCKFSFGYDLVGDSYAETGEPVPDPDPLATCNYGGHGTHVSGIIGMDEKPGEGFGLQGVAPDATLGMYRVFACLGGTSEDTIIAAILMAAEAQVDVISISLGIYSGWSASMWDPFPNIVTSLQAAGIAVIAAVGNDGAPTNDYGGPFSLSSPGVTLKALGVASIENSHFQTGYHAEDSNGKTITYASVFPISNGTAGLKVIPLGDGSRSQQQWCYDESIFIASAAGIENFSKVALLVLRGGTYSIGTYTYPCSVEDQVYFATLAGFKNIIIANDPLGVDPFEQGYVTVAPEILEDGSIWQVASVNAADGATLLTGTKSNTYKLLFSDDQQPNQLKQPTGGSVASYSSQGPSWELDKTPDIGAPGTQILSTWPAEGGSYCVISGTSMAAPYIAGTYALVKSQFPHLSPEEIFKKMTNTATQVKWARDTSMTSSVGAQGAGLINALTAISAETEVTPVQLQLGGLEDLKKRTITITNRSKRSKTYTIEHKPAGLTKYTIAGESSLYSSVAFSDSKVRIAPGGSSKIVVTFSPPHVLDSKEVPTYSGFLTIKSNEKNDDFATISYFGVPFNRRIATQMINGYTRGIFFNAIYPSTSWNTGIWNPIIELGTTTFTFPDELLFGLRTFQPSRHIRFDYVPYDTSFVPTLYGFDKKATPTYIYEKPDLQANVTYAGVDAYGNFHLQKEASPMNGGLISYITSSFTQDNPLDPTVVYQHLKKGDYRILIRVLRWSGNATAAEDFESWLSPIIRVLDDQE